MLKVSRKLDMKGKSWVKTSVWLLVIFLEASGSSRSRVLLRGGSEGTMPLSAIVFRHSLARQRLCAPCLDSCMALLSECSPSDRVSALGTEAAADPASGACRLALDADP